MVFLEHVDEDDWTYEVLEGSHNHFEEFCDKFKMWKARNLTREHQDWLMGERQVRKVRVTCPKGGILLTDARMFRADTRPAPQRAHPGRWRFMIYVCMTPASWATEADLAVKRRAYENLDTTTTWPSQRVTMIKTVAEKNRPDPYPDFCLPEAACSEEAKKLVGLIPYGRNESEGVEPPAWNDEKWEDYIETHVSTIVVDLNRNWKDVKKNS